MKTNQLKAGIATVVFGIVAPIALLVPSVSATANPTWTGGGDGTFNSGLNWYNGAILVNGDTAVFPASANYQSPLNDISGLSLVSIVFNGDVSGSSSKSYDITGNGLTVTSSIEAIMTGSGGDHQIKTDMTLGADASFKTTGSNTLSIGDTATVLDLGSHGLTLDASGGTITLLGKIVGSGNIVQSGAGKSEIKVVPGTGGYTGGLTLSNGETAVNDNLGLNVSVNGGTLKGTGTVGDVTMSSGKVAPGLSPGVINTGDIAYTGGTYDVELGGTADGQYDQTNVTGTVDLGSATTLNLQLVNGYTPAVNDVFTIINNDGTDAIQGSFVGLANGGKVTLGEYTYQINYDAGDGNDVRVLVTGTPSAPDTGVGSLLKSPLLTIVAAIAVIGVIAGHRYADSKRR